MIDLEGLSADADRTVRDLARAFLASPADRDALLILADRLEEVGETGLARDARRQYEVTTPGGVRAVEVLGRRWSSRTYGNTYHTAEVSLDGEFFLKTPRAYGYGNQYQYTAWEYLRRAGVFPDWDGQQPPYVYCADRDIAYEHDYEDVRRRRDL